MSANSVSGFLLATIRFVLFVLFVVKKTILQPPPQRHKQLSGDNYGRQRQGKADWADNGFQSVYGRNGYLSQGSIFAHGQNGRENGQDF